jgi:Xaa-Pro aminopeptidase
MKKARLIYAASELDADILYASRFFAPDAFLWWKWRGKSHIVLSPLELNRGRRDAQVDKVHAFDEFIPVTLAGNTAQLIAAIAKKQGFDVIEVPSSFPVGLAFELKKLSIRVDPVEGAFFPERRFKSTDEVKYLTAALRKAECGLYRGFDVIRQSKIGRSGVLRWGNSILTSEILRGEIDAAIIKLGALPAGTIAAGGDQSCDPHERGTGPLHANETIIMDIFPRDQETGYFGDLTRTVVKGRASETQKKLYATVAEGKRWVQKQMRPGADGRKLHEQLVERFRDAGFPTENKNGRWVGFFHGTGHGLGLEIHESPRFSSGKFKPGLALTVEPGLYYPGLGGVRLEDVTVVKKGGITNLTRAPQFLEIR